MNIDVLGTEIPPDLSSSTEGDNGNGDVPQTSLCIGLGVFVGLLMIIMISLTLWRRSRPRRPQSSKQIMRYIMKIRWQKICGSYPSPTQ